MPNMLKEILVKTESALLVGELDALRLNVSCLKVDGLSIDPL